MSHRIVRVVVAAFVWLCLPFPAFAQDALLMGGRFLSATRNFGEVLGPGPALSSSALFGGGRYVAQSQGGFDGVTSTDIRSGAGRVVRGALLAADRARPILFVARRDAPLAPMAVWAVDVSTGGERLLLTAPIRLYPGCAHAYSANVLFCASLRADAQPGDPRADVLSIDVATGATRTVAVVPLFAIFDTGVWYPVATPDARRLYFTGLESISEDLSRWTFDFVMLDPQSGAISRQPLLEGTYFWDDATERLVTIGDNPDSTGTWISIYTKDVVPLVRRVSLPAGYLETSPHTNRTYVAGHSGRLNGPVREQLFVFDAATFALLAPPVDRVRTDICGGCANYQGGMAVLTAPGPPRDVAATATAGAVNLSWTNVGAASHFVLDVGLARGRTDLSVFVGTEPRASFAGVPPGSYYLRLRGGNEFGGGRPSAEIRVVVP